MIDFTLEPALESLVLRVREFVRDVVLPVESKESEEAGLPDDVLLSIRNEAKQAGLWTPHLSEELGGLGLTALQLCFIFEEAGYSPIGALALNCAAPDEGNMHLLHLAGTEAQQQKYLQPLAAGECRSCFAMTEPAPGAGSDPTMMQTLALKKGNEWVINGHKWFTSGAEGARFAVVAAVTDPDVPAKEGVTLFLVDADNPGWEVVRKIPVMGSGGPGGHCEVNLRDCTVPTDHVLGELNQGFRLMQARLGPARLTHCMRWIGAARRGIEIARDYAKERYAFGQALSRHQAVQWMLADSMTELQASRLMTLQAGWKIQQGDKARRETSACKVFVAEAVHRILDRAVQICGSLGYSGDLTLERTYRDARAFRIYDGPSEVHRMVLARELFRDADALAF